MPENLRKAQELLARVDEMMHQAQSLRTDITKKMNQQRADDRSVSQPLGSRKPRKRRN